jgi:hypothetical protein
LLEPRLDLADCEPGDFDPANQRQVNIPGAVDAAADDFAGTGDDRTPQLGTAVYVDIEDVSGAYLIDEGWGIDRRKRFDFNDLGFDNGRARHLEHRPRRQVGVGGAGGEEKQERNEQKSKVIHFQLPVIRKKAEIL